MRIQPSMMSLAACLSRCPFDDPLTLDNPLTWFEYPVLRGLSGRQHRPLVRKDL